MQYLFDETGRRFCGGAVVLAITTLLDRMVYGSWVIVPLNFVKFNFLSSGGDYYGTHPWHWYFTQGFPVMIFTFLPFSLAGIIDSKLWKLFGLIGRVIGIYSLLGHKEFSSTNWPTGSSSQMDLITTDVVAPSAWTIFGCQNGLRLFKEAKDRYIHGKRWDDHPAIMAVGVVDGTSENIFRAVMSLGSLRSQ